MSSIDFLKRKECRKCGAALTLLQQLNQQLCDRLECRAEYLHERRRVAHAERDQKRRALASQALKLIDAGDIDVDRVAVVPSVDAPVTPVAPERVENLRDSLQRAIEKVVELRDARQETAPASPAVSTAQNRQPLPNDPRSRHMINACTACRGGCCRHGNDHAYINADVLAGIWASRPELTADDIIQQYMVRVPARSVANSCIYHSVDGCQLTREMRSSTCNDFICEGLRDRINDWSKVDERTIAVAADDADRIRRISDSLPTGERRELHEATDESE